VRAVRERPRVAVAVGWAVLSLVLVGALIGAMASMREGDGARKALEAARFGALEARAETREAEREAAELRRELQAERRKVVELGRELRSARHEARADRRRRR